MRRFFLCIARGVAVNHRTDNLENDMQQINLYFNVSHQIIKTKKDLLRTMGKKSCEKLKDGLLKTLKVCCLPPFGNDHTHNPRKSIIYSTYERISYKLKIEFIFIFFFNLLCTTDTINFLYYQSHN